MRKQKDDPVSFRLITAKKKNIWFESKVPRLWGTSRWSAIMEKSIMNPQLIWYKVDLLPQKILTGSIPVFSLRKKRLMVGTM